MRYNRSETDYLHISQLHHINNMIRKGWELTSFTYRTKDRVRLKFRKPINKP